MASGHQIKSITFGLILARGGSVGIPLKNIKPLLEIPLIGWTLREAKKCHKLDEIWVSTDDERIADVARQYGGRVHKRPAELATHDTPAIDAIKNFIKCHNEFDVLVLLQATSPFLQQHYINQALQMIQCKGYDSVFAVTRQHKLRWQITDQGDAVPSNFDPKNRPQRQDWNGELIECGMFYCTKINFLQTGLLQGGRCGCVEIANEHSIDIDTPHDWMLAEQIAKQIDFQNEN